MADEFTEDTQDQTGGMDASGGMESGAPPQATAPPAGPPLHQKFGLGDEWADKGPEDIAGHLHQERQRDRENYNTQLRQAIAREQGMFQSPEWKEFQSWKTSQVQGQKPGPQEPKPWERPKFDRNELKDWIVDVKDPVTGEVTGKDWKPNTPSQIIQSAHEYQSWRNKFRESFDDDPYKAIEPYLEHRVSELNQKHIQEALKEQALNQRMLDLEKQHASWMYEKDTQSGQILVDNNGYPVFSPFGQAAFDLQGQIKQSANDPVQLMNLAMQMIRGQLVEAEYEKIKNAKTADETNEDKKAKFQENIAKQTASRGGSLPKPAVKNPPRQNKKLSFAEEFRQALQVAGQTDPNMRWN